MKYTNRRGKYVCTFGIYLLHRVFFSHSLLNIKFNFLKKRKWKEKKKQMNKMIRLVSQKKKKKKMTTTLRREAMILNVIKLA